MKYSLKKKYYSLSKEVFNEYLEQLKKDENVVFLFKEFTPSYFYVGNEDIQRNIIDVNKAQVELDLLFDSFSSYQKEMIEETLFIQEIQSSNSTENIYSTRSDIFEILKDAKQIRNKKVVSITNSYISLKETNMESLYSLSSLRNLYDNLMKNAYESKSDQVDGQIFRKNPVYISNGIKSVHEGFYPESNIQKGVMEYIEFIKNSTLDIYLKIILSHFMIETIHPFYDGNGRYGRYLMSIELYNTNQTVFSMAVATAINEHKKKYYDALKTARDIHEFGYLDGYVLEMSEILLEGIEDILNNLKEKKQEIKNIQYPFDMTKSEKKIFDLLHEASVLTYFGINNENILNITGISKRTLMTTMKKFKEMNILEERKLGKVQYHKLRSVL